MVGEVAAVVGRRVVIEDEVVVVAAVVVWVVEGELIGGYRHLSLGYMHQLTIILYILYYCLYWK